MNKYSLGFILFILINVSCDKTMNFEDINLLIKRDWHLTTIEKGGDVISEPCDLDDVLTFNDDAEFHYQKGELECYANEGNKESVKWKLIDDYKVIRMKFKIDEGASQTRLFEYWEILQLNDTLLMLREIMDGEQIPEVRSFRYD
jgi:hypothetical protein